VSATICCESGLRRQCPFRVKTGPDGSEIRLRFPQKPTLPATRIYLETRRRRPLPLPRFGLNSSTAFCQAMMSSSNQTLRLGEMWCDLQRES
jgi:hypothetical protein